MQRQIMHRVRRRWSALGFAARSGWLGMVVGAIAVIATLVATPVASVAKPTPSPASTVSKGAVATLDSHSSLAGGVPLARANLLGAL